MDAINNVQVLYSAIRAVEDQDLRAWLRDRVTVTIRESEMPEFATFEFERKPGYTGALLGVNICVVKDPAPLFIDPSMS